MNKKCECGCGNLVKGDRRFVSGHNLRVFKRTELHNKKIGTAQKAAWKKSPDRLCFNRQPRKPVGSTWIDPNGYVLIKIADGCKHWKSQHILVVEEIIGRKLHKPETIHHINGVRSDNRKENLLLCSGMSEHNKIEATWKAVLRGLMEDGIVVFNHEKRNYERAK